MAEETKDEKKEEKKRWKLKFPWADHSIAEEGAQTIEALRDRRKAQMAEIDEELGLK